MFSPYILTSFFVFLILFLFFFASKNENWESQSSNIFECGFSCYYYSRFSFSSHYFIISLIFLFLDLEICVILPIFNEDFDEVSYYFLLLFFIACLLLGLVEEWVEGKLDWSE